MTIRTRLTLWYAGILCVSTLLIAGLSYREFALEKSSASKQFGSEEAEQDWWEDVVQISILCAIPATLLGLIGGWWLMSKSLSPVAAITEAAKRINDRNLRESLPRTGNGDELDKLTEVFNSMTERLDASFQRIREFTLHASHELKTPLTVMQGELETALREENLSEPHHERILNQLDELQRLTKIVNGLTLLTKADAGQVQLKKEPLRLDELVRESYDDARILAHPHGLKVHLQDCDEVTVLADRHRLRQLLLNLTDNAIKYNSANGTVDIGLLRKNGHAEITIRNSGAGIPPESVSRVFDRFFRGDESHNGEVDGCGLGLSIAQWIVVAHDGTIEVSSEPKKSTVVTVRLAADSRGSLKDFQP
ncbi:MAG: ATP-binding protein [Verrucomicrobiota bacterium]